MSRNYYSEIYLHLVWRTKDSRPMLVDAVEDIAHRSIRQRLIDTPGAYVYEIGGVTDHVHVCLSIAPTVLISTVVGEIKGAAAYEVAIRN